MEYGKLAFVAPCLPTTQIARSKCQKRNNRRKRSRLGGGVIVVVPARSRLLGRRLGALALDAARPSAAKRRGGGKVDVLLRVEADDEGGDVDDLLADADVALADEDTGVVDGLGEAELEDLGLEAALEEILDVEGEAVIQAHARLVQDSDPHQASGRRLSVGLRPVCERSAPDQGIALKEALRVLVVELQQFTGGAADLGEGEGDAPDLALVAQAVFARQLQLGVQARRLEGPSRDLVDCAPGSATVAAVAFGADLSNTLREGVRPVPFEWQRLTPWCRNHLDGTFGGAKVVGLGEGKFRIHKRAPVPKFRPGRTLCSLVEERPAQVTSAALSSQPSA
jgi:hypothetical protein